MDRPSKTLLNEVCRHVKIYGRADQGDVLEPLLVWATPGQRGFGSSSQRSNVPATQRHSHSTPAYTSYHDPHSVSHNPVPHKQSATVLTPAQEAAQKKLAEDMRKSVELRQILNNLEKVNDEGRRANLLDQLLSTEDVLTLPEHPNPPGVDAGNLTVNLLKHQACIGSHCEIFYADSSAETSITLVHQPRESGPSESGGRPSRTVLAIEAGKREG
jgi:hypothetical protein